LSKAWVDVNLPLSSASKITTQKRGSSSDLFALWESYERRAERVASAAVLFPHNDRDERLKHLAEMASNEQDLQKFMALVRKINLILAEKQERLGRLRIPSKPSE
jgi:hypothetical protein